MAVDEVYSFTVATPANTPQGSPLVTPAVFPARIVDRIEWNAPAGSLNAIGFQISMRGVPVIPANAGGFIVPHLTTGGWDMVNAPDSGDWSVTTFNTGMYPHSIAIIFHVRLIPRPAPQLALIPDLSLHGEPAPDYTGV